ncbi:MAG TPA: glycosylasparaginase, partial [Cytophagales bacterium]|nr:glycosylasparaginase [Cytophagales bacterium]
MKRRSFLRRATLSTLAAGSVAPRLAQGHPAFPSFRKTDGPVILSTWAHGVEANAEAWRILEEGGSVLDAVEKGVMVTEADPKNQSVGIGGLPDRDGRV